MKSLRQWMNRIALVLLVASVVNELRKPPAERTWHGKLFEIIPYDFRVPSVSRVEATFWNPNNPNVVVPTLFGVGWSVNLYPIFHSMIGAG